MVRSKIAQISAYVPERVVDTREVETRITRRHRLLARGALEKLFGIRERRFAAPEEQVSDLACAAARPIVERWGKHHIDLLIFAAASADLIDPAPANIVQDKLGLHCPALDLKNACNSFVTAIQAASAYIQSGLYQRVLIVNGEKLSDAINFELSDERQLKRSLAAFSLGDAGAAALVTAAETEETAGIYYQKFLTVGKHWPLCTIEGGGSRHPHDPSKLYFEGQTVALKEAMREESQRFVRASLRESPWSTEEVDHWFTHQVSTQSFQYISEGTGLDLAKSTSIFEHYGNTAAASIPLAMHCAERRGKLGPGDKIALIGLAAGISASVQLLVW